MWRSILTMILFFPSCLTYEDFPLARRCSACSLPEIFPSSSLEYSTKTGLSCLRTGRNSTPSGYLGTGWANFPHQFSRGLNASHPPERLQGNPKKTRPLEIELAGNRCRWTQSVRDIYP